MSDFDKRQYDLMLKTLDDFTAGHTGLAALIGNLEGLLNAVRDADNEWRQSFLHFWGVLEEVRAVALFRAQEQLEAQGLALVVAAVQSLRQMILEKMKSSV